MLNLVFKHIESPAAAEDYLVKLLNRHLKKGERVLWLVPGGSAMDIAVTAAKKIGSDITKGQIVVTLTDERYGPPGHNDSNWQQLQAKGFSLPAADMQPVLAGRTMSQTAAEYGNFLNEQVNKADFSLALAGMGPDGHIFGIKPGSPSVNTKVDVTAYNWDDYRRITPTINFIKKLDEVIIYAMGAEKHGQLDNLAKEINPEAQPAQLLKKLKKVIIFNDHKGEPK